MNVPHHPQERDYSCLPACVRMVLAYYGRQHSESELRGLLKTRPGGTSPANVILNLPSLGFDVTFPDASLLFLREQTQAGHPCIVHVWTPPLPHWQAEAIHAVVVVEISEDTLLAHDPIQETGPTHIPLEGFMQAWAATDYSTVVIKPKE